MQESETPALQGLSFTVRPGELLAVVGPVGAGKVSCDAFCQLDAIQQPLLNSQEWNPELSVTQFEWLYLEGCFSKCVPWNISFVRRFCGHMNWINAHYVFLLGTSRCTVGN